MYSMARYGGFTDSAGDFEHSTRAFIADALSITIGSCFGSSSCTAFVESGAGIAEGGRTGITAIVSIQPAQSGWIFVNTTALSKAIQSLTHSTPLSTIDCRTWFLRLHLLLPNLCQFPAMVYWSCLDHCRIHDDIQYSQYQLGLPW